MNKTKQQTKLEKLIINQFDTIAVLINKKIAENNEYLLSSFTKLLEQHSPIKTTTGDTLF